MDSQRTAARIAGFSYLLTLAIVCDLLYCAGAVALITSLFVILRTVDRNLALLSKLDLSGRFDRYYGGLLLYGLGATLGSWLWLRSRFMGLSDIAVSFWLPIKGLRPSPMVAPPLAAEALS